MGYNITEEGRKQRSERMKALHREGKAGPQFGKLGGRPKKPRASEIAAELAREDARLFYERLKSIALYSDNERTSVDAIKHIHTLEEQERKIAEGVEVEYEQLKHNELLQLVVANLIELNRQGTIDLGTVVEAEFTEISGAIGSSEID